MKLVLSLVLFLAGCASFRHHAARKSTNYFERTSVADRSYNEIEKFTSRSMMSTFKEDRESVRHIEKSLDTLKKYVETFAPLCADGDEFVCGQLQVYQPVVKIVGEKFVEEAAIFVAESARAKSEEEKRVADYKESQRRQQEESNENRRKYEEIGGDETNSVCLSLENIDRCSQQIADQKEIGKTSGVVNQSILYEAGACLQTWKKELPKAKELYRKKMGKAFDSKLCNNRVRKKVVW